MLVTAICHFKMSYTHFIPYQLKAPMHTSQHKYIHAHSHSPTRARHSDEFNFSNLIGYLCNTLCKICTIISNVRSVRVEMDWKNSVVPLVVQLYNIGVERWSKKNRILHILLAIATLVFKFHSCSASTSQHLVVYVSSCFATSGLEFIPIWVCTGIFSQNTVHHLKVTN